MSFEHFLNQPEPEKKTASYSDFQAKMWTVAPTDTAVVEAPMLVEPAGQSHGMDLGETMRKLGDLTGKLKDAMSESLGNSMAAVAALKDEFKVENKEQKVVLPEDLITHLAEKNGITREKFDVKALEFGAQTVTSDEQFAKLASEVNRMKNSYAAFSDAEIHLVKQKNGEKVAVVIGVNADEFNSVRAAENTALGLQESLQKTAGLGKEKEKETTPKDPTVGLTDKVAELSEKYPNKTHEATPHVSPNDLQRPAPSYAAVKKSGALEVA